MRLSEFRRAVSEQFGEAYSEVLIRDHWLSSMNGTAQEALGRGEGVRDVWLALCEDLQVPPSQRYGRGLIDPRE